MIHKLAKFTALDKGQWIPEKQLKMQIVLHHTAGLHSANGVLSHWNSNKERVATPYLIDNTGKLTQCFDDEEFAYALYVSAPGNQVAKVYKQNDEVLNRTNIGIELTNAGWLTARDNAFYPSWKKSKPIAAENVVQLDFRGQKYWETYYPDQLVALEQLLRALLDRYPIIKDAFRKQHLDFLFDISTDALKGRPGIYTHCSYRTDKTDVYPHPGLIDMLKRIQQDLIAAYNNSAEVDNPFGL